MANDFLFKFTIYISILTINFPSINVFNREAKAESVFFSAFVVQSNAYLEMQ